MMLSRRRVIELPAKLANQIAAGEVVARPANVVKELVENALDAGARKVRVEIDGGGVQRIAVIDDGSGMDRQDAELALRRHATSKLRSIEDLHVIDSFGFRGEALPTIASVSNLTLRTRTSTDDAGVELRCDGGGAVTSSPWGGAPGTTVEVANLFYNVPARRKFLRAVSTESAHVGDVVRAVALSRHDVHVELARDGRAARRWLRVDDRSERIHTVLDDYELIPCLGERGPVRVEAYLSRPDRARSGAGGLWIFVCGRPVQDRALARAVASAYGDVLERGRYPVGVVFVDLPLDLVDINVHPQKAEVRFAHARAVTDAVHQVVASTVRHELAATPHSSSAGPPRPASPSAPQDEAASETWSWSGGDGATTFRSHEQMSDETPLAPGAVSTGSHRFIGHADRFVLFEEKAGIVLVDARRARAELLALLAQAEWNKGGLVSQRLLFPTSIDLSSTAAAGFHAAKDTLARFGFDARPCGPESLAVHAVPRLFAGVSAEVLMAAPLMTLCQQRDLYQEAHTIIASMAADTSARVPIDAQLGRDLERHGACVEASVVRRLSFVELAGES